ncbi:MAG: NYN domain-containing protein [Chloroflexi bacterium]|nr:NYN domain-containing protein [Chloroflexota bacterium]
MELQVRLFIDFWNFQLNWNSRTNKDPLDWRKAPIGLVSAAQAQLDTAGMGDSLRVAETRVYASYDTANPEDRRLKGWLDSFLDRQPGMRVFTRERRSQPRPIRCSSCGYEVSLCSNCSQLYRHSAEKGVDSAIVTDLLSLAWESAFDVAILVSSDADYVPAVERLQEKGFKIINATWSGYGHHLARTCWASFEIDSLIPSLRRT